MRLQIIRCVLALATCLGGATPVLSAQQFPDTYALDGQALLRNGAGVRTYGVFNIQVYNAALYLPAREPHAQAVLDADTPKVVQMHFLRSASQEDTRAAWQHYLEANCRAPCVWPEAGVRQFSALLPATVQGESQTFVFRESGLEVLRNGQTLGRVADRHLARLVLATWLGDVPTTPALKRALLGGPP